MDRHFVNPPRARAGSAIAGAVVGMALAVGALPGTPLQAEEAERSRLERDVCASATDRQIATLTYLDDLFSRLHDAQGETPSADLVASRVVDLTRALEPRRHPLAQLDDDLRTPAQVAFYRSPERGLVLRILQEHGIEASEVAGAVFAFADLNDAALPGAKLSGANLFRAHLARADLRRADLRRAILAGADLYGSSLLHADLGEALLVRADLRHADLENAQLGGADLRGAKLRSANLCGAGLDGAILFGVDLSEVRNLVQSQLEGACTDDATLLPEGLRSVPSPELCDRVDTSRVRALFAAPEECGVPPEPELRILQHSFQSAPAAAPPDDDSFPGAGRGR